MILTLPLLTATAIKTMEVIEFSQDEIRALLDLIESHDDWEECSEQLGVDVEKLYDKISAAVTY